MGDIPEIVVGDLQELIFVLTQDVWQPSEARFRMNVAYRGLPSSARGLDTGLARLSGHSREALEGHLLRNFRKYAYQESPPGDSVWNWVSLAQHHGLPTRLLDWTFSPYVALHFATATPDAYSRPAAVWCVDYVAAHQELPEELASRIEPMGFGLFTTEILESAAPTLEDFDRFRDAQGAALPLFFEAPVARREDRELIRRVLRHTSAEASLGEWLQAHPGLCRKVVIPEGLKWAIRNHLDQANVTERVLFPGLDGLSRWLRRYYGNRPEDLYPHADPDAPASGAERVPGPP